MTQKRNFAALEMPEIAEQIESPTIINNDLVTIDAADVEVPEPDINWKLNNKNIAILSETGFEQSELFSPKDALEHEGFKVDVISSKSGSIKGWDHTNWGLAVNVNKTFKEASVNDYDALVLPGGVMNPDKLRMNKDAVQFVTDFIRSGKPVAAICHGPQTLIETGLLFGKTMTSYPSLRTDLENAGVHWVDKEMVHDGQFITSRNPADLGAFNSELIRTLHG